MGRPAKKILALLVAGSLGIGGCTTHLEHAPKRSTLEARTRLAARMRAIGTRLGELGYTPSSWHRRGVLEPGAIATASLRTDVPGRIVLVAIGSDEGANLDLTVRGPGGGLEAQDSAADLRAAVELATARGARYSVTLTNVETHESTDYLLYAFAAHQDTEPAPLFGLFDADPLRNPSWDDIETRMDAASMRSSGPANDIRAGRGERNAAAVQLVAGRCYMFVAQGSPGIDALAVRLSAQEGLIAADLAERSEAWIQHCAEADEEARLTIEVLAGSGTVRSGAFTARREDLASHVTGPPLVPREPPITVAGAVRWADRRLARSGYDPGEVLFEGEIDAGERRRVRIELAQGECAALSAVSGAGLEDLDIEVESADGRLLAADSTHGPSALVRLCASETSEHAVALIGRGGRGRAVLMVNRLPRVDLSSWADDLPRAVREAAALFHRRSLVPLARLDPLVPDDSGNMRSWTVSTELDADRCYGITAAIDGSEVERLELRHASGAVVASWQRDGLPPTVTSCATESGSYDVRIAPAAGGRRSPPVVLIFGSP